MFLSAYCSNNLINTFCTLKQVDSFLFLPAVILPDKSTHLLQSFPFLSVFIHPSLCSSIHQSSGLLKPETHQNKAISFVRQSSFH